jgi:integrase
VPALYISYYWHGRRYVESAKSDRVTVARELLKRRLGDMSSGRFVGPNIERTTFKDLAELVVSDYANNKFRSMVRLKRSLGFLDKFFGKRRAVDVDSAKVAAYITERLSVGAANATVNRELSTLKRMFSLGVREKKVSLASVPSIRLLKERNARKGFVEHDQYLSLRNELPEYLKPILAFLYYTGVRDGEALALKWNSVDLAEREIRIEADANQE